MPDAEEFSLRDSVVAARDAIRDFLLGVSPKDARERWNKGPTINVRSGGPTDYEDYVQWIRQLEASPLGQRESAQQLVQRLRRLYYSVFMLELSDMHDNSTPWMLDILTRSVTPRDEPPLTTDDVPQSVLDGLFGTSVVTLPDESTVSPAHLWASADLAVNGSSTEQGLSRPLLQTNVLCMAGWLGDLSNAINMFAYELEAREGQPNLDASGQRNMLIESIRAKASRAELLGDMDGLVLGRHWARHPAFTISNFFNLYYGDDVLLTVDPHLLGRPSAAHRFHLFLNEMDPQLPISGRNSSPLLVQFDLVGARNAMPNIMRQAIHDLNAMKGITLLAANPLSWVMGEHPELLPIEDRLGAITNAPNARAEFHFLCDEFCRFLDQGVRSRDPLWY